MKQYTFTAEPRGDDYRLLVAYAAHLCHETQFIVRDSIDCSASAVAVLASLEPWLLQQTRVSEWAGTRLHGGSALLFRYRNCAETVAILGSAVGRLYDWVQPDRPEDLALMFPDGTAWLTTIAHERDAYLTMSDDQAAAFFRECGRVAALLGPATMPP